MKLLRVRRAEDDFLSATSFETVFQDALGRAGIELDEADFPAALHPDSDEIATISGQANAFARFVEGYQVVCPDYHYNYLLPLWMLWRHIARLPLSFCIVAHSPAVYALEWALLQPLMTPRDVIIAPTHFARSVILALNPALAPRIEVIGHPSAIDTPQPLQQPDELQLLSLTRIIPGKFIHRQVDALVCLQQQHGVQARLTIAGELLDRNTGYETAYVTALRARVQRLGLTDAVHFAGRLDNDALQSALASAHVLLNLSASLEESYGKAVVEALSYGVPVVITDWDGLRETAGSAGSRVPVLRDPQTRVLDIAPDALAEAILDARVIERARCQAQANVIGHPTVAGSQYYLALQQAQQAAPVYRDWSQVRSTCAAPPAGLLSRTAPLTRLQMGDLFRWYLRDVMNFLTDSQALTGLSVRQLLIDATSAALETHFLHVSLPEYDRADTSLPAAVNTDDIALAVVAAAGMPANTAQSRFTCIMNVRDAVLTDDLLDDLLAQYETQSIEALSLLIRSGQREAAWTCAAAMMSRMQASDYLILRLLCKLSHTPDQITHALALVDEWLQHYPDDPFSFEMCLHGIDLTGKSSLPDADKKSRYATFSQQFQQLIADPDRIQQVDRVITRYQLAGMFRA